jgi:uncharacterized membrane protein YeaQ/YmgE (transglycosylase-associated protein family)
MEIMDLIWTLVVGGVIGWVASILMKTNAQMGLAANVVVGIVGAFLGAWLAPKLGLVIGGTVGSLLLALGGAVLLIFLLRLLKVLK